MNIGLWRQGLKQWLSTKLLVDTWELRNPLKYNTINGFIPPLTSVAYVDGSSGEATGIQDFYLSSKYSGDTKYDALPIGQLEQTYVTIQRRLSLDYPTIAPLSNLEILLVPDCIQVAEDGEGMADWLVTLIFSCNIAWVVSPTLLPGDEDKPLPVIHEVNTGLFTGMVKPSNPLVPNYQQDFLDPARRNKVGNIKVIK
jgi:hypothetical protein